LYLAAREHRPGWLRVDRWLGEHGIQKDDEAGRKRFEQWMEKGRAQASQEAEWEPIRRGRCFGSEAFRAGLLRRMEGKLGEHHSGQLKRQSAQAKGERITDRNLLCAPRVLSAARVKSSEATPFSRG